MPVTLPEEKQIFRIRDVFIDVLFKNCTCLIEATKSETKLELRSS